MLASHGHVCGDGTARASARRRNQEVGRVGKYKEVSTGQKSKWDWYKQIQKQGPEDLKSGEEKEVWY